MPKFRKCDGGVLVQYPSCWRYFGCDNNNRKQPSSASLTSTQNTHTHTNRRKITTTYGTAAESAGAARGQRSRRDSVSKFVCKSCGISLILVPSF